MPPVDVPAAWERALVALEDRARSGEKVILAMVNTVMAWATVEEIASRVRGALGEPRETLAL